MRPIIPTPRPRAGPIIARVHRAGDTVSTCWISRVATAGSARLTAPPRTRTSSALTSRERSWKSPTHTSGSTRWGSRTASGTQRRPMSSTAPRSMSSHRVSGSRTSTISMVRSPRPSPGSCALMVRSSFRCCTPCFPGHPPIVLAAWPPGAGYFDEGWWVSDASRSRVRHAVGANHRTLSTYVNALLRHGLEIERMTEPEPPHT